MTKHAFVFVHGVNQHDPKGQELRNWNKALEVSGINVDTLGIKTSIVFYADWFFAGSNETLKPEGAQELLSTAEAAAVALASEGNARLIAGESSLGINEAFDITTLIPSGVVQLFMGPLFGQLYAYFDNDKIKHPISGKQENARTMIRSRFVSAVNEARKLVGEDGRVDVLAHSMGSVVAWDCLQHEDRCAQVDRLVTFGSPIALDFVQRELKKANGRKYKKGFPRHVRGEWHNITSRLDAVGRFDTDIKGEFGQGAGHAIFNHRMVNPVLGSTTDKTSMLRRAHDLYGYLQDNSMAAALDVATFPGDAVETTSKKFERRFMETNNTMRVAKLAARRFAAHEGMRNRIQTSMSGTDGIVQVEDKERIIQKLSLLDYPPNLAHKLVKGLGHDKESRIMLERVLGEANFLSASFAQKAAALTAAVGKVQIGAAIGRNMGSGTGFLISRRLIMTNNHVLPDARHALASEIWFDYNLSSEDKENDAVKVRLRPDLFFVTSDEDELDYTIVAIEGPDEGLGRPWCQLISTSGKALLGDHVNIIQHPKGRRQEIVVRDSRLTFLDSSVDFAHYEGDTEPGSSGAPVFNDRWQLAFLHHSSVPERDAKGRVLKTDGTPYRPGDPSEDVSWIANEGIRISRIVKDAQSQTNSSGGRALLDGAFEDPDLTEFVHIGRGVQAAEAAHGAAGHAGYQGSAGGGMATMPVADPSGRWLFELSFGPVGHAAAAAPGMARGPAPRGAAAPADTATPPPSPNILFPDTAAQGTSNLKRAARFLDESAPLESEYYDADKDDIARDAYYMDVRPHQGTKAELFKQYNALIRRTHTKEYSYSRARLQVLYPYADRHPDGFLRSIYSGEQMPVEEVIFNELQTIMSRIDLPIGAEALASPDWIDYVLDYGDRLDLKEASLPYNCEHIVPQSWFNKRQPMKADLHHLFTCESDCNSFRGNYPYYDFEEYEPEEMTMEEAAKRDGCGFLDEVDGQRSFEPQQGKGAAARATLYFILRYPEEIGDHPREMKPERIKTLIDWHEKDEVTEYERHRNRAIYLTQGNRNPFIDFPDLHKKLTLDKGVVDVK